MCRLRLQIIKPSSCHFSFVKEFMSSSGYHEAIARRENSARRYMNKQLGSLLDFLIAESEGNRVHSKGITRVEKRGYKPVILVSGSEIQVIRLYKKYITEKNIMWSNKHTHPLSIAAKSSPATPVMTGRRCRLWRLPWR